MPGDASISLAGRDAGTGDIDDEQICSGTRSRSPSTLGREWLADSSAFGASVIGFVPALVSGVWCEG